MSGLLYVVATALLAAALALGCKVRTSRTLEDAAPWFALMGCACAGAMWAALLAGSTS